jgi:5'-nucleotidase, C-terminal domain
VIVENGVKLPDGTYLWTSPTGPFVLNPALVDAETKAFVDKYRVAVAPIANRIVGSISADITRTANAAQESALGDVIADAQLAYTQSAGAQIAFMNPGGIRTDHTFANSPGGEAPGQVTCGESFAVQPFNNLVTTQTFTGAQIKDVLEQQRFPGVSSSPLILQVSAGILILVRRDFAGEQQGLENDAERSADRPGRHLSGDDERLPRQRWRRVHHAHPRHQPGVRTRLRRRRAGGPSEPRPSPTRATRPHHPRRLTRSLTTVRLRLPSCLSEPVAGDAFGADGDDHGVFMRLAHLTFGGLAAGVATDPVTEPARPGTLTAASNLQPSGRKDVP